MSEVAEITSEQIAAYQRKQQQAEQQALERCANDLVALANERGFVIVAVPQLSPDGRLVATWGVQKRQ